MSVTENEKEPIGFTIYWRIENFNSEPADDFCVRMEEVYSNEMMSFWQVEVGVGSGYLGAFIQKRSNTSPFLVHYSLSYLTSSGWKAVIKSQSKFVDDEPSGGAYFVDLEALRDNQWFHLPVGSLTVRFHLWNSRTMNAIRRENDQCFKVSRVRMGNSLRHRPRLHFNWLTLGDFLSFPSSYDFSLKAYQERARNDFNENCSRALTYHSSCSDIFPNTNDQSTKEVKTEPTQSDIDVDFHNTRELLQLFKETQFSFVTLRTPNRDFFVHKAVLCAKSPVFKAMFERHMEENQSNVVNIDDVDSQTMISLIKFLHFEPLGDLEGESVMDLYYAADKYQIDTLKKECVSLLKKKLSAENICNAILLADLHHDQELMHSAQEYFCKNSKVVLLSKNWKDLLLKHTELASNILFKLAEKM